MIYRNLYQVQYMSSNSIAYCDPQIFKAVLGLNITTCFIIIIFFCLIYIFNKETILINYIFYIIILGEVGKCPA
jgi:multisubunit Na+/H+ antiporter MnhF subunit